MNEPISGIILMFTAVISIVVIIKNNTFKLFFCVLLGLCVLTGGYSFSLINFKEDGGDDCFKHYELISLGSYYTRQCQPVKTSAEYTGAE